MNNANLSLTLKRLLLKFGAYGLLRRLMPNSRVSILRYHAVVDPDKNTYTAPGIALSPAEFEAHVRYFCKRYNVMSMDEVVDCLRAHKPLPKNSVVFTFDDGYKDNLAAARTLNRFGGNAIFYLTTEPINRNGRLWLAEVTHLILTGTRERLSLDHDGVSHWPLLSLRDRWRAIRQVVKIIKSNNRSTRDKMLAQLYEQLGDPQRFREIDELILTWDEVREMRGLGMSFGAHTTTHLNLPNADPADAVAEIEGSKKQLEEALGEPVRHFSYPNSGPYEYYDERIRQYVIDAGFDSSTTSDQGFAGSDTDFFAIKRVRTVPELAEVLHGMEWDRVFGG